MRGDAAASPGWRSVGMLVGSGALLLVVGAACTIERGDVRTPSGQAPEADTAQIRRALEDLVESYAAADAERLRSLVTEDMTFIVDGVRGGGANAFVQRLLTPVPAGTVRRELRIAAVDIELVGGETAWVTSQIPRRGGPVADQVAPGVAATLIYERFDADWRLVHVHLSRARDRDPQ